MTPTTHSGLAQITLPTDTSILITREFNAPKDLVYRAWTTPELVKRWWSGLRGEVTLAEIDLRVGGRWRYVMLAHGAFEVAFHGEYREVVENELIVTTEVFEALPHIEALSTTTFSQLAGVTTLSLHVQHATKEARDGHINSGMEGGLQESWDKLALVASGAVA